MGDRCPLLTNKYYFAYTNTITQKTEACTSDKQCRLRNLPKVSCPIMLARNEPRPSAQKAGFIPTTQQVYNIMALVEKFNDK